MNKENFKIGDLVEIKQWDEMAEEFGLIFNDTINVDGYFTKEMKNLCGKRFKIKYILGNGKVEGLDCEYEISTDMIKKVDLNKKEYQCTGEIEFILSDSNGDKVLYCPCKLESVKSKPDLKISQEEFNKALEKIRNIELPHDLHKRIKESSKELRHSKYKVISGAFKGFIGEIVDSNKNEIGLCNEDGEKCYVKRDSVERVRTNYIDERISYGRKLRNGIIEVSQDKNKTRVEIIKDDKTFIGEARCMEGDNFDKIKGCKIATKRAYIKFHQYKVRKLAEEMTENAEISKEYIKYKTGKIFFKMNRILQLKEELKELCK